MDRKELIAELDRIADGIDENYHPEAAGAKRVLYGLIASLHYGVAGKMSGVIEPFLREMRDEVVEKIGR